MCGSCGCHHEISRLDVRADMHGREIDVREDILERNDTQARANRALLTERGICAVNLMSSPGSGKTRLLEASFGIIPPKDAVVIEGDLETENDADRIRGCGVEAIQITTGMACHLDAKMIAAALGALDLTDKAFLFIENVGNLICPASFDLGQHWNVVLLASTEGDDKPEKYPAMFAIADLVLITKADLLPVVEEFNQKRARAVIRRINPEAPVITISAKTGEGMAEWAAWLEVRRCGEPGERRPAE